MKVTIVAMFLLIAAALPTAESCQPCPIFWVPYLGNCYRIFAETLTWTAAENKCQSFTTWIAKGHLVSIRSKEENEFVSRLWNSATDGLVTREPYATYWIGLTDARYEGTWRWSDTNQLATYTNWDRNQPDNHSGNQDCVTVWNRSGLQTIWDDKQCNAVQGYVCKLPQNNY
ncbi:echinoidin-like [Antedon mediterranea]|uniref:echinoidin-like n=1 Tax=Antedon mediterranea TaxID=105859 RepID=UPI003AF90C1A